MLLEFFYMEHLISKPLILNMNNTNENFAGALKCMYEIPLNTHSYYLTAIEMEVKTLGVLSF